MGQEDMVDTAHLVERQIADTGASVADVIVLAGNMGVEQGGLSAEQKARLEMLMLRCWREGLVPADAPMADVLAAIAEGERTGEALGRLQRWLHRPGSGVTDGEIVALLRQHLPAPVAVRP